MESEKGEKGEEKRRKWRRGRRRKERREKRDSSWLGLLNPQGPFPVIFFLQDHTS